MKQTYDAKILYYKTQAKLATIIELRKGENENSDVFRNIRILTLDGRKLHRIRDFKVHSHDNPSHVKICTHKILCYDDFYVVEKTLRKKEGEENKVKVESELFDYDGNSICSFGSAWDEKSYFSGEDKKQ